MNEPTNNILNKLEEFIQILSHFTVDIPVADTRVPEHNLSLCTIKLYGKGTPTHEYFMCKQWTIIFTPFISPIEFEETSYITTAGFTQTKGNTARIKLDQIDAEFISRLSGIFFKIEDTKRVPLPPIVWECLDHTKIS